MPRWLKITVIGCGGLIGLFILLDIVGTVIGGDETATEQPASESASEQAKAERAKKEAAEARREAEAAKEEAAQAKKEAEEAEAAKAEAEAVSEEEPAPAPEEGDSGTAIVRVTGVEGEAFTGLFSVDSVTAVMQKAGPGANELKVEIVVDGEVVKETSTTAEHGVAR